MQNYYQFLEVPPLASQEELTAAIDTRYNQIRRLIYHHDQKIVNQVNQTLVILEEARSVLLDPARRAEYDQQLNGSNASIGGLTDPSAIISPDAAHAQSFGSMGGIPVAVPTPNAPIQPPPVQVVHAPRPPVGWDCPRCHTANPVASLFCKRCGETIGITCPECNRVCEVSSTFCQNCGANLAVAIQRKELDELIAASQEQLAAVKALNPKQDERLATLRGMTAGSLSWLIVCALTVITNAVLIFGLNTGRLDFRLAYIGMTLLWAGQLVLNWIIAGVMRVKVSQLAGAGWANFFILLVPAVQYYLISNGALDNGAWLALDFLYIASMFFVGLAAPRNFRKLVEEIKKERKWFDILIFLSRFISLIAYLNLAANLLAYGISLGYLPDSILEQINAIISLGTIFGTAMWLTLAAFLACGMLLLFPGLLGLRMIAKTKTEVRSAEENQRQQTAYLQAQLEEMERQRPMLH